MLIKDSDKSAWLISKIKNKRRTILILYSILFFFLGAVVHRTAVWARVVRPVLSDGVRISKNFFKGLTARPEHITIDISYMNYQKLVYNREIALADGVLLASSKDYVPARIQYKDKTVRARIRLKGDWIDGIEGDKWAFRLKIRDNNTLFGMKELSIHHPRARNYINEWIFHQALKREEILSPRYEFIEVTLNGKDLGIYALEEHFEKILIESNKYREGPIIKFDEDILWADRYALQGDERTPTGLQSQFSADIDAFNMNNILRTPSLFQQFIIGKDLLESFRNGILPAHKVFDIKKLAKYFAISELMGGLHGAGEWHNLRFYYNPITSLLEPIGFDADAGRSLIESQSLVKTVIDDPDSFYGKIFNDIIFFGQYVKALGQISDASYLDRLFEDIDIDLQKNLNIIYSEFPDYRLSKDIFYKNQLYLRALLNPFKGIHGYFHKSYNTYIELILGNIQSLPIEVVGVTYKDSLLFPVLDGTILLSKNPSKPVNYQTVSFSLPENFVWSDAMIESLKVEYKLLGTNPARYETVFPYSNLSDNFIKNDFIRQSANAHNFEFLSVDESTKKIFIKPGHWNLEQNLIIPHGYKLVCHEGTQLDISNSAKILSYSPLEFLGSEDYPIIIGSANLTGQGIIVMNTEQMSLLRYVVFDSLYNPSQGGWELTGAVTFYESPVEIYHCKFLNNRSEDSLNIVRSKFRIDKTIFSKALSDAFDADFSEGKITASSFIDCGNDAIDVSGSIVEVQNVSINGAGDKGLSVGENSKMTANKIEIRNTKTAVASKDMSETVIGNIEVFNCKVGFNVYQKKPEFGLGYMKVKKIKIEDTDIPYIVENKSTLFIEGKLVESAIDNAP